MTREEALAIIKLEAAINALGDVEIYRYEPYKTSELICDGRDKIFRKWEVVKDLFTNTQPSLDENGLARCGCGGKAHLWPDGRESRTYHVVCCECRASAHYFANEQEAKDAWNRAMGVKGADE